MSELFDLPQEDNQELDHQVPEHDVPAAAPDPVPEKAGQAAPRPTPPKAKEEASKQAGDQENDKAKPYMVLARKYRPQTFKDLVGQEALVQTLTNAIKADRIHHAYVLTGIRGIGKTTTARILAKALNCENGPSTSWEEGDQQCKAIADGRHVDVLEFDAASHTGVDDVRSLFEGVGYQPVQGRYKIYIIDEVHMLSRQAFNALLKTLEEPPAHVKFIFATTEVNKIPVTVLSRCQRFDLKRISVADLSNHFTSICEQENIEIESAAVAAISRAADGSVRDGLSLLDQAIALSGGVKISEKLVSEMLGQAGAVQIFQLLEKLLAGDGAGTLTDLQNLYHNGHDPVLVTQDVLRNLHLLTRLKIVPELKTSNTLTETERTMGVPLADKTPLDGLGRAYQMLLTALDEAKRAPRPMEAIEMAMIRVAYVAPVPALQTILQSLGGTPNVSAIPQQQAQAALQAAPQAAPAKPEAPAVAAAPKEPAPWEDDVEDDGDAESYMTQEGPQDAPQDTLQQAEAAPPKR